MKKPTSSPSSWSNANIVAGTMREIRINIQPWENVFKLQKERSFSGGMRLQQKTKTNKKTEKVEGRVNPTENIEIYAINKSIYTRWK